MGKNKFFFTFGSDPAYPFCMGYIIILADCAATAREVFKAYFPNRPGSNALNCAWIYTEKQFMRDWDECWCKSKCHGIIGFMEVNA